jgi:hypothetical protein
MDTDFYTPGNDAPNPLPEQGLIRQVELECQAMVRHILQQGLAIAPELVTRLATLLAISAASRRDDEAMGSNAIFALTDIHCKLTTAVAPATPLCIVLLDPQRLAVQRFAWLGPVPLIRMLTVAALTFLIAVMLTGLSSEVSSKNIALGMLESDGAILLSNLLFLLCCAGLGASFAALFHAHRYIANSSYDPKYDASYCARLILGVIAGLFLSELLPSELFEGNSMANFGKPALAILGGFSSTAVYHILQRLIETLDALVLGDPSAQYQASLEACKAQVHTDRAQARNELAAQLLALQQVFHTNPSPELLRQRLAELTLSMLPLIYDTAAPSSTSEE